MALEVKIFGVFDHDFIWTLVPLCAWFWAAGGSGFKPLRRFGVPASVLTYAIGYGLSGWSIYISAIGMLGIIGFGPGYGDDFVKTLQGFYWPYIFLLGGLYGLCQFGLCLHFGGWLVLFLSACACSFVFGGTMYLSKKFDLPWKAAEILTGSIVGLTASLIIN